MASSSPLVPKILKGAFIRLDESGIGPLPQIVAFQYNPESLTRKLKPYEKPADKQGGQQDPADRAAPYHPEEEMDVVISFDAMDDLAEPAAHPQTVLTGVADRIAALEMLMYPPEPAGLLTSAVDAIAGVLGFAPGDVGKVPMAPEVPVVLFAWGPGRILPVKVTSFTVEEQAFNSALYPIRAKLTVGIKVLTEHHFKSKTTDDSPLSPAESIACAAYRAASSQKKVLAASNVANGAENLLATLPF